MDVTGMTQLQAIANDAGILKAVIGLRSGGIWYGEVREGASGHFEIFWHVMRSENAK